MSEHTEASQSFEVPFACTICEQVQRQKRLPFIHLLRWSGLWNGRFTQLWKEANVLLKRDVPLPQEGSYEEYAHLLIAMSIKCSCEQQFLR